MVIALGCEVEDREFESRSRLLFYSTADVVDVGDVAKEMSVKRTCKNRTEKTGRRTRE